MGQQQRVIKKVHLQSSLAPGAYETFDKTSLCKQRHSSIFVVQLQKWTLTLALADWFLRSFQTMENLNK